MSKLVEVDNQYRNPKLIICNSIYLFIRMLFIIIISFYTTRLSLQFLGNEDFGINNIIGGITAMFAILSIPIVTTQQRFFNVELSKKLLPEAAVFSTSVKITILLAIILFLLFETIGLYVVNYVIAVPSERMPVVNIVFQITAATNIISMMYIPYQAYFYAKEKIRVCAAIELFMAVAKLLFLFLIPSIPLDRLVSYCSMFLVISSMAFLCYSMYCRGHFKTIKYRISGNRKLFKEMWSFSRWNLIESAAGIFMTYGSNILMNVFGGVLYNTAYGISKQLSDAVNNFTLNVLKATEPQITSSHIINDKNYRDRLVCLSVKTSLILTGFIAVVFINEGAAFLALWLVDVPEHTLNFSVLAILASVFAAVKLPLRSLIMANGKIKLFFSSFGVLTFFILLLAYFLLANHFPIVVMMYLLLLHSMLFVIISIYLLWKEVSFPVSLLIRDILVSVAILIIVFIVYAIIKKFVYLTIVNTIVSFVVSVIVLGVLVYLFLLDCEEKRMVKHVVNRIVLRN